MNQKTLQLKKEKNEGKKFPEFYFHKGLLTPFTYAVANDAAKAEVSNGCGAAGAAFDFVPDTIYGLRITDVCNIHDWMYHFGETWWDKLVADAVMLINTALKIIFNSNKWMTVPRLWRAATYFGLVFLKGDEAFWAGKEERK